MTEPVIINGVDVSGCGFLEGELCSILVESYNKCECCPDCYYKQLQRKTVECEELKADYEPLLDSKVIAEVMCEELKNKLQIATEALENILNYTKVIDDGLGMTGAICSMIREMIIEPLERIKE